MPWCWLCWSRTSRRIVSPYRPSQGADGGVEFLPKPYFELEGERLVRHHDPVPREPVTARELESNDSVDRGGRFPALRKLVRSVGLQGVVQQLVRYQPTPEYDNSDDPAWRLMRAILLAWRALVPQPVVLMPLPLYQHIEGTADASAYRQRFAELAREGKFVLHDPLDDLQAYDADTKRGFRFKQDVALDPGGPPRHSPVTRRRAGAAAGWGAAGSRKGSVSEPYILGISAFITIRPPPSFAAARSLPPPRRSASHARSTTAASPATPSTTAWAKPSSSRLSSSWSPTTIIRG